MQNLAKEVANWSVIGKGLSIIPSTNFRSLKLSLDTLTDAMLKQLLKSIQLVKSQLQVEVKCTLLEISKSSEQAQVDVTVIGGN